ncbi:MAG: M20/M25/M40 family metallo-hydrolase [Rhodobacterales bacterium]|nr:M20/M25/M40 family metallo-hydrolase [Rhodobacterales bacterium]
MQKLESWGIDIHRGFTKTGVVGTLRDMQEGRRAIPFRANMDALPMEGNNILAYRSTHAGIMHACGHDGHTSMLLGAARYLAEHRKFAGTTYFIFQPAEEDIGGARLMIEEGLFERFPVDSVWGMYKTRAYPREKWPCWLGPLWPPPTALS